MKTSFYHVIVQKDLRCQNRKFELHGGAMIFLKDASTPMIEWLQEIHINDTEALFGDTDVLMKIPTLQIRSILIRMIVCPVHLKSAYKVLPQILHMTLKTRWVNCKLIGKSSQSFCSLPLIQKTAKDWMVRKPPKRLHKERRRRQRAHSVLAG